MKLPLLSSVALRLPLIGGERRGRVAAVPAFYKRRKRRTDELGQVLLRLGAIQPEHLRTALRLQEEHGGQLGAILLTMGACSAHEIADALVEQLKLEDDGKRPPSAARHAMTNPATVGLEVPCKPVRTRLVVVVADLLALAVSALPGNLIIHGTPLFRDPPTLVQGFASVLLCMAAFSLQHLYEFPPPNPPEEMARTARACTAIYAGILAVTWMMTDHVPIWRVALGVGAAWLSSIVLVVFARAMVRRRFSFRRWWGFPVLVLGAGKVGRGVVRTLRARPQLGLRPVAIMDDDTTKLGTLRARWGVEDIELQYDPSKEAEEGREGIGRFSTVEGVPVVGSLDLAAALAQRLHIDTAIVALPDIRAEDLSLMM
jgi:hypothetical protein